MEVGRTLPRDGDVPPLRGDAVKVLGAVVRVWHEHGEAVLAWRALHREVGDAPVDVGPVAKAARGQDGGEDEVGEVRGHLEVIDDACDA